MTQRIIVEILWADFTRDFTVLLWESDFLQEFGPAMVLTKFFFFLGYFKKRNSCHGFQGIFVFQLLFMKVWMNFLSLSHDVQS